MSIADELKAATADSHQVLEKMIVRLIQTLTTCRDYIDLLGLFYSYFGALEILTDRHISSDHLPDIKERRKAHLIYEDLMSLSARAPDKTEFDLLPAIHNYHQAFGAMYVIEGSSLGGSHIARMINKKLPGVSHAMLFFEGYGNQTLHMWNRFKSSLENLPGDRKELESMIGGAKDTFLKFAEWINLNTKSNILI